VQVFDTQGRLSGIIAKPQQKFLSNICFGGKNLDTLYVTTMDKVYRRKLNTQGVRYSK
jgi:gluconolactonase